MAEESERALEFFDGYPAAAAVALVREDADDEFLGGPTAGEDGLVG